MTGVDFLLENHGSLWLVRPVSSDAQAWLEENTDGQWFGGALAVEPRYVGPLVEGAVGEGFEVSS